VKKLSGPGLYLFKDIVNSCSDISTSTTPKSMCTKLLMNTVKRDIPAVEASYELSNTYFAIASISSTDGLSGSLIERMRETSPLALQP
jgi:hypothetical protein